MNILRHIFAAVLFLNQMAFAQMPGLPGGPKNTTQNTNPTGGFKVNALPGEGQKVPGTEAGPGVKQGQADLADPNKTGGNPQNAPKRDYSRQDNPAMGYDPNKSNLTDQEYGISKQHHQGKAQREFEEKCVKTGDLDDQKACAGQEAEGNILGISTKMVGMLSKAYVLVIGVGGIGDTYQVAKTPADPANKTEADDGKRSDYCKYIALGTEAIATFQQMSAQNNLQNTAPGPDQHKQIAQLEKARLSHVERSKTAKIQAYGWTATTGCYAATITYAIASGGLSTGGNIISLVVKAAASSLFMAFAWVQVGAHEDYADRISKIIKEFATKDGNCNPITQRDCYCAQPDTQSDPTYCTPYLHQRRIAATALRISCLNNELKADPKCSCATNDTCFDKKFFNMTSGLNFGSANDPIRKTIDDFSRGQLTGGGTLNSASLRQNAKRSVAGIRGLFDKFPAPNLTSSQLSDAKEISAFADLPPSASATLAAEPMTAEAQKRVSTFKNSIASYSGGRDYQSGRMARSNTMYFGGGNINGQHNKKDETNIDLLKLAKGRNPKGNFLKFQQKAEHAAQINRRSDTNLFEIISRRYQVTGRRALEITE